MPCHCLSRLICAFLFHCRSYLHQAFAIPIFAAMACPCLCLSLPLCSFPAPFFSHQCRCISTLFAPHFASPCQRNAALLPCHQRACPRLCGANMQRKLRAYQMRARVSGHGSAVRFPFPSRFHAIQFTSLHIHSCSPYAWLCLCCADASHITAVAISANQCLRVANGTSHHFSFAIQFSANPLLPTHFISIALPCAPCFSSPCQGSTVLSIALASRYHQVSGLFLAHAAQT